MLENIFGVRLWPDVSKTNTAKRSGRFLNKQAEMKLRNKLNHLLTLQNQEVTNMVIKQIYFTL